MDSKGKSSISYTLFLYREELKRRQVSFKRLSRTKISLTDKLITKSVRNLEKCTTEDLRAINQELLFKKKLKHQIKRIYNLEKLGIRNANPNLESTEL
ncbi:uncharacterized protein LOC106092778 [Stomoxys calcitrans]|uniref:Uncharacterized protein n=1 Tax=Stomoxys calcitrans TaxID=35570 RepID=A0A1I8NU62_STOCA|nr:uncharacterized protein LOC106092778 [Stomoxys calcitrans]